MQFFAFSMHLRHLLTCPRGSCLLIPSHSLTHSLTHSLPSSSYVFHFFYILNFVLSSCSATPALPVLSEHVRRFNEKRVYLEILHINPMKINLNFVSNPSLTSSVSSSAKYITSHTLFLLLLRRRSFFLYLLHLLVVNWFWDLIVWR
jgi:hypothetical protein